METSIQQELAAQRGEKGLLECTLRISNGQVYKAALTGSVGYDFQLFLEDDIVVSVSRGSGGRWQQFLGRGSYEIRQGERLLGRICYGGLFGFRRILTINDINIPLPQRPQLDLPAIGYRIEMDDSSALAVVECSDDLPLAMALTYFLWVRLHQEP